MKNIVRFIAATVMMYVGCYVATGLSYGFSGLSIGNTYDTFVVVPVTAASCIAAWTAFGMLKINFKRRRKHNLEVIQGDIIRKS